jgi:hypothetical protein
MRTGQRLALLARRIDEMRRYRLRDSSVAANSMAYRGMVAAFEDALHEFVDFPQDGDRGRLGLIFWSHDSRLVYQ